MRIVINGCYGGFGLSHAAVRRYAKIKSVDVSSVFVRDIKRNDPILVKVVEELGKEADGDHARLKTVEIPDDVDWQIEEYDGFEHVAESHRTWY